MKIAFVVHDFLSGIGHGRYCIELARRFSRDHEIHVLANRFEKNLDFQFQKHPVRAARATALTAVLTFPNAAQKMLDRENFDIVHAQGFSCHRADVITAHVCNAARYAQNPPRTLRESFFPRLVIPREKTFFQNSGALAVIAVSKQLQQELTSYYDISSEVIYHGVDTTAFQPTRRQNLKWTWLYAGQASKGLDPAIRALRQFPEAEIHVASRSELSAFERLAAELGVAPQVIFHGAVSDMQSRYSEADIFVYPSTYDTFAMVVAEAMSSGLPVVIGKKIGSAEWINDGENGFLCEPPSIVPILKKIRGLSRENIQRISDNARATALLHSWDKCAEKTLEVYHRAISSKRTSK